MTQGVSLFSNSKFEPRHLGSYKIRNHAPNLSNIFALACIRRIKNFDSKIPSEPMFAPVSVKRSNLSEPENCEFKRTGCGCHEWPLRDTGVEWSPVITS